MKLIRTIYEDKTGRLWEVEQILLPRPDGRRGVYRAWLIQSGKFSHRAKSKRELFDYVAEVLSIESQRKKLSSSTP